MIFSGYNQRAIIAFLRVCERYNIPIFIVSSIDDSIEYTKYSKYIIYRRKNKKLDMDLFKKVSGILNRISEINNYIILPNSEYINRFTLENKNELNKFKFSNCLVDVELYELISDKYLFGQLCHKNNILIPKTIEKEEISKFPIVLKAKKYQDSKGNILSPRIISTNKQLRECISDIYIDEYYFQEFISGESYYLLYYICKDEKVISFSQKNLLQQDLGKSILAAKPADLHFRDISEKFENLFKSLDYKGLVMVEVKKYKGKYYMIEANPRLWGPSQLFVDSNVPLFEYFLLDLGFNIKIEQKVINNNTLYFWYGGLRQLFKEKRKLVKYIDSYDEIIFNIHKYMENDIYKREDTIDIYNKEIGG